MSQQRLNVVGVKRLAGIGKESKKPYEMYICQCTVTDTETGDVIVGEIVAPKDAGEIRPGLYEFAMVLTRASNGRLEGRIQNMALVTAARTAAKAA
jgi:hypothetical protein